MTLVRRGPSGVRACLARAGERRLPRVFLFGAALGVGIGLVPVLAGPPTPEAALPSGQEIASHDWFLEEQLDGQVWLVMRYLAPRIARDGGDLGYDDVIADFDALCHGPGRAAAADIVDRGGAVDQVVLILMDRAVPRGEADPTATTFIAAYTVGPEECAFQ